jgi:putative GTP pyrophosphokinase
LMAIHTLSRSDKALIGRLVGLYVEKAPQVTSVLDQLIPVIHGSPALRPLIHSSKWRVKDPQHLRDKLERKLLEAKEKGRRFLISEQNLFTKVNDLAGFRILHLYTDQIKDINQHLLEVLHDAKYRIVEGPVAKVWDDVSRSYFKGIGIKTERSDTMYTSVHYVIEPNRRTLFTAEIQVRTLMEEVWGEVDHKINYPHATKSVACVEQIAALARLTSGCTRLVDSIFNSYAEWTTNHKTSTPQARRVAKSRKA